MFTIADMASGCDAYLYGANFGPDGIGERRAQHMTSTGWYSEAVIASVIAWKIAHNELGTFTHLMLDLDNPVLPNENSARRIFGMDTVGLIVNKEQSHWVAFKIFAGQIWLLDSTCEPEPFTFQEYLAFLRRYPNAYLLRDDH